MKNMKYKSQGKQLSFNLFESSLTELPNTNRWVQLGESLPWDKIEKIYNAKLNNRHGGAGNKPARIIIGALLIKHKMGLSDEETIQAICENPYMQNMLGLSEFTSKPVFDPSLFVTIRKRIGVDDFNDMSESLLKLQVELQEKKEKEEREKREKKEKDENGRNDNNHPDNNCSSESRELVNTNKESSVSVDTKKDSGHSGLLKIDASCADAEVRYPTDLDLIHDGVEIMDRIIGRISAMASVTKPKTHVKKLHSRYLNVIKLRSKPKKKVNECKEYLLTWLGRNIYQCVDLIAKTSSEYFEKLKPRDKKLFSTVIRMYEQQKEMLRKRTHQCANRIVSVFQPHVRPILRGKARNKTEFGAKIGACIVDGYTFIDHHSWDAYNECEDLMVHLRCYKQRFGKLPEKVEADKIYLNRKNRRILRLLKIEIGGKPLGRPSKEQQTKEYQELMAKNVGERNEVEATFGTAKRIYRANNIRAKLSDTGASWTACCYFAKNVMKFLRELLYALILMIRKMEISVQNNENYYRIGYPHFKYALLTRV